VRLWPVDTAVLNRFPRLRVVVKHGAGVDNIDCEAAAARGVEVAYTPTAVTCSVAEHTLGLLLAVARHIPAADTAVRARDEPDRAAFLGTELAGKTLGIVGYGRVGRHVASIAARGFSMHVRVYDPFLNDPDHRDAVVVDTLDELLREADFVTLHVPLTAGSRRLLDAERIKLLKPGARVVNTARGGLIDETALAQALHEGRVAGAALDVFEQEPLPPGSPLRSAPNLVLTPHIASSTDEAMARTASEAADAVIDALEGRTPTHVVRTRAPIGGGSQ
jgi:D-3-phosphoglycerate dehydrogenase